ncbi:hypothetical protein [Aeromicrobium sp. CF3.5]|uniref:hypothetical protein n=1 Tax=Aeromicrobium sp. CF3.5 TaxID=3373078 RepID=UPI003EE5C9E2
MKTATGWAISAIGVVLALAGVALMVVLGPDNRIVTGPHPVDVEGSVVVTGPRVIRWTDAQVDILAELPAQKPMFLGIGNSVDVESLVDGAERVEVTGFDTPWDPTTRVVDGRPSVQAAPTSLDWWLADSAGLGGASISLRLPEEPVSLAIVSIGASNLSGLQVTLAYGIQGGFTRGIGLLLLGLGGVLVGLVVRRRPADGGVLDELVETDEGIVYVVGDDDGVERELTADEIEAGGFVVTDDEMPPPPELVPEPTEPAARVMYVFVDEDGVEHEVSEDELDEFEIVEDDDVGPAGAGEEGESR